MNNLDKLKKLIQQADELLVSNSQEFNDELFAWETKTEQFLESTYGKDSIAIRNFKKISLHLPIYSFDTPHSKFVSYSQSGIRTAKKFLENFLEDFEDNSNKDKNDMNFSKVFIVHGHNGEIKQKVARLVEQQNIKPIILDEQVNAGKTIIEKFEQHSNVGAAICLFTADDTGKANKEKDDKPRARQNVVLETGFFMGKLGRERLVIIAENGIELPSDMQGVVYINNNWEFAMLKELKNMGFDIDMNKLS